MKSYEYGEDMLLSGMKSWNTLSELIDPESKVFDDISEFEDFYTVVMFKLLEEEEAS